MTKSDAQIKGALALGGDPEQVNAYYQKWAASYDQDVNNQNYTADKIILDCCQRTPTHHALCIDPLDHDILIHDAGCGTGLLGSTFHEAGYKNISGSDLSNAMITKALQRNIYTELSSGVDLTQPIRNAWKNKFDVVLCGGVFTSGHVPPETLLRLFEMTSKGGLVIVSTRTAYYDVMNYQAINNRVIEQGKADLLLSLRDAPYTQGRFNLKVHNHLSGNCRHMFRHQFGGRLIA